MTDTIRVENIRTGTVHAGKERIFRGGAVLVVLCNGYFRDWSEYRRTDKPITCKRCLR